MIDVSIIMPAYNVKDYIKASILSVINQTYQNWELIIINDGSTDNTLDIIQECILLDSRIVLINQENRGVSATRNRGITLAKGEYISFLDADDSYDPHYIELMTEPLKKNIADMVFCKFKEMNQDRIISQTPEDIKSILNNSFTDHIECIPNAKANMAMMYRTQKLKDQNIQFYVDSHFAEDSEFVLKAAFSFRITFIPEYLYIYIYRKESASRGGFTSDKYLLEIAAYTRALDFAKNNISIGLTPSTYFPYMEKLLFTTKNRARRFLWEQLGNKEFDTVKYFLQEYQRQYNIEFTVPFKGLKKITNWPKLAVIRSQKVYIWACIPKCPKKYGA